MNSTVNYKTEEIEIEITNLTSFKLLLEEQLKLTELKIEGFEILIKKEMNKN